MDVIRAIAIFLVLGNHLPEIPHQDHAWLRPLAAWKRMGWVGVDLFFVLSGFLIAGLLFQEFKRTGTVAVNHFYVRRGFKIYPAFFVFLLASVLLAGWLGLDAPWQSIASEASFMQSYYPGMWPHTWSLAVEEHFYILLPMLFAWMIALSRRPDPFRHLPLGFMVLALVLLAARLVNAEMRPYRHLHHTFATHLRIDSLTMGVVLAYLYHFHAERFVRFALPRRRLLMGGGVLLLTPTLLMAKDASPFIYTFGFTLCYLGAAAILAGMLMMRLKPTPLIRSLAYIGSHSYSIYLWHFMVLLVLQRVTGGTWSFLALASVYLAGSVVGGVLMAKLIEMPVLALRDRWYPSRTSTGPAPSEVTPQREPAVLSETATLTAQR